MVSIYWLTHYIYTLLLIIKIHYTLKLWACLTVTWFVAGVWALYFLAANPDCQEKLYEEIRREYHGELNEAVFKRMPFVLALCLYAAVFDAFFIFDNIILDCRYLGQVIDESLRCSLTATVATRFSPEDMMLGGHVIPGGVTVIHALSVVHADEKYYPNPLK